MARAMFAHKKTEGPITRSRAEICRTAQWPLLTAFAGQHSESTTNALLIASPNLNGRCERVILTIKSECLSKSILFGKRHLDHVLAEFTEYYNTIRLKQVQVNSYVGGLVKSFERKAA